MNMREAVQMVKKASIRLAAASAEQKNTALMAVADALMANENDIVKANLADIERSERENLAAPLMKRLRFDAGKIRDAVDGIESLMALPDPVGRTITATELDAGLELYRVSCPIGVIGIIFESRPDALVQISSLCLKSGNGVLLKGGSEARETNRVLADVIAGATGNTGVPDGWLHLLETRDDVNAMLAMDDCIDLVIPRGSNEFVRYIMDRSNIPVLGHADGICHCYVDAAADVGMAVDVVVDSKVQYVAVCNALETLLVHEAIAPAFLPPLKEALVRHHVELRGCDRTRAIIECVPATEADWGTEYLDYILSIRIVGSLDEAIDHINANGSGHTDGIVTGDAKAAAVFMDLVDSADVFWNCSTRFSDGFRYGLGAEVGISTNKIHARGPVGLEGLMIYKYKMIGAGQTVADYAEGRKKFTHRKLDRPFPL